MSYQLAAFRASVRLSIQGIHQKKYMETCFLQSVSFFTTLSGINLQLVENSKGSKASQNIVLMKAEGVSRPSKNHNLMKLPTVLLKLLSGTAPVMLIIQPLALKEFFKLALHINPVWREFQGSGNLSGHMLEVISLAAFPLRTKNVKSELKKAA